MCHSNSYCRDHYYYYDYYPYYCDYSPYYYSISEE